MNYSIKIIITTFILCLFSCSENKHNESTKSPIQPVVKTTFETMHSISEDIYNGDGSWGKEATYKMALRDAYWRADVYLERSETSSIYSTRSLEVYTYLQAVQSIGDNGVFGFPADVEHPEFGEVVNQVLTECPECITNGWVTTLPEDFISELYYDHGYALVSLSKGYLRVENSDYYNSIVDAAEWALDKPLVRNLNYLSALSKGLSYAFQVTGDIRYLDRAIYLHEFGIFPYLSTQDGAALDVHNRQLEYHGFIVSGIIALKKIIPGNHEITTQLNQLLELSIQHMQQRGITEDGSYGVTWPGTNLLAWYELEQLRVLSLDEAEAKERCISLIDSYKNDIIEEKGFRQQKAIYTNFFIGLYEY